MNELVYLHVETFIGVQKFNGSEIHEIGMPSSYDNVTMCLINKKLDEWASPFESYLLSLKEDLKNIVSFIILIFSASFIIFDS